MVIDHAEGLRWARAGLEWTTGGHCLGWVGMIDDDLSHGVLRVTDRNHQTTSLSLRFLEFNLWEQGAP